MNSKQALMKLIATRTIVVALLFLAITSCKKESKTSNQNTGGVDSASKNTLKDAADIPIGVAIGYTPWLNEPKYSEVVKKEFDQIVCGYEMKHGAIVQSDGSYNFSMPDALVAGAGSMGVFGHVLCWHENQNAAYLKSYSGLIMPSTNEYLTNPGFENGNSTWVILNAKGATITFAADPNARTGNACLKVINPTAQTGNQWKVQMAGPLIATTPGKQYVFSYWVKAASTGSIRLSTLDQENTNAQYQGDQVIGTTYQQVSWTITAKSSQTRFLFDMGQVATTYYIDDASFKEVVSVVGDDAQIAAKLDTALNRFITAMISRYKSKIRAWDVYNEPFTDGPVELRNNSNTNTSATDVLVWSNYLGRDAALKAFKYAKAADSTADFYINDYNLELIPAKLDSLIAFVAALKLKGAKIDGIGTQMHISSNTKPAGIDNMFQKLAATGLKIRMSELDVKAIMSNTSGVLTPELAALQADTYKYAVQSYFKYIPKAQQAGITIWGVNDKNSWLYKNGSEKPLMFDDDYNKKPAYFSVFQALQGK